MSRINYNETSLGFTSNYFDIYMSNSNLMLNQTEHEKKFYNLQAW